MTPTEREQLRAAALYRIEYLEWLADETERQMEFGPPAPEVARAAIRVIRWVAEGAVRNDMLVSTDAQTQADVENTPKAPR